MSIGSGGSRREEQVAGPPARSSGWPDRGSHRIYGAACSRGLAGAWAGSAVGGDSHEVSPPVCQACAAGARGMEATGPVCGGGRSVACRTVTVPQHPNGAGDPGLSQPVGETGHGARQGEAERGRANRGAHRAGGASVEVSQRGAGRRRADQDHARSAALLHRGSRCSPARGPRSCGLWAGSMSTSTRTPDRRTWKCGDRCELTAIPRPESRAAPWP